MATKTKTVGVRLTKELLKLLGDEAARRRMTPSTFAKKLVVDGLTLTDSATEKKLAELQAGIERLERLLLRPANRESSTVRPAASLVEAPARSASATRLRDFVFSSVPESHRPQDA